MGKLKAHNFIVKCISFNREIALEFDPLVMGNEIMKFVDSINKVRYSKGLEPLKTKDSTLDLYEELKKFF